MINPLLAFHLARYGEKSFLKLVIRHSELRDNQLMAFEKLSTEEQRIVLVCMKATAAHIEDWEKHSRLGLEPSDLGQVIAKWPNIDDGDESGSGFLAINNCLNEVCHGFAIAPEDWNRWFDTPMAVVEATYKKWLKLKGISGGIR